MVELRKRKTPTQSPPSEKRTKKAKASAAQRPAKESGKDDAGQPSSPKRGLNVGDTIHLDGFGGEIETHDGTKTTLKKLVDSSNAGVVLFTYPRASTPGCTKQACLFRDDYDQLSSTGLSIYGLSADSPKANTTFKSKQNLPYSLLCDVNATLITAVGFGKTPKGTVRGVFALDKKGRVLACQAGGPDATVKVVQELVKQMPAMHRRSIHQHSMIPMVDV